MKVKTYHKFYVFKKTTKNYECNFLIKSLITSLLTLLSINIYANSKCVPVKCPNNKYIHNSFNLKNNLFDSIKFLQLNTKFYAAISGGYSRLQYAEASTGQSGVLRLGLGNMLKLTDKFQIGSELGFQTGSQMLLRYSSTYILGENTLPITLYLMPPVDILLSTKYDIYKTVFIQAKGGGVNVNTSINGADVKTNHVWMPELQIGIGNHLSSKHRLSINYQRFFGKQPILNNYDEETGVSYLKNMTTLQAILITAEINI